MTLAEARRAVAGTDVPGGTAVAAYMSKLAVRRPEQVQHLLVSLDTAKPVNSYTRQDLVAQLQDKARKHPTMANRMLTRWKDFFSFCEQQGWVTHNPLTIVQRKFIGGKEKPRDRVLSWEEIEGFLRLVLDPHTKFALYFILATGLRSSEALWVLRTQKTERIPTKTTLHRLPQVPHVKALLKLVQRVPASHLTLSNALRRKGVDYTPHDLRRTFATRLSDLGVHPHVIEKCLNHRMEGVMAVYNHSDYWDERVKAMRLWGHKLSQLRRSCRSGT